jgi:hypothetical protein
MVLPGDYRTAFVPVRQCAPTVDHGLGGSVIVRMRPEQSGLYGKGPYPYPQGTLIVKEEYRDDDNCAGLTGYAVMRKQEGGYFPEGGDWQWFSLDSYGGVLKDGKQPTCAQCHRSSEDCGPTRDFTCVVK